MAIVAAADAVPAWREKFASPQRGEAGEGGDRACGRSDDSVSAKSCAW